MYGKEKPLPPCSIELAQPLAPEQPRRDHLQDQQLAVNEAAVTRSLSLGDTIHQLLRHMYMQLVQQVAVMLSRQHRNQAHAILIQQQQASVNSFEFARSDLPGSQVSTPRFQSCRACTNDSLVDDPGAHCSSPRKPSMTGDTLRSSTKGLCATTHVQGCRHTEDLSHLSLSELPAVRRLSNCMAPVGMGHSQSTTEHRCSWLGTPPSGPLPGPEVVIAESAAAVSRNNTLPMSSSCGQAAVSVTVSGSTGLSLQP